MNKELLKLLGSIKLNPKDTNRFGESAVFVIKKTESLHDPKNNYAYLRKFLKDRIKFLESEIKFTKKYAPDVFHDNVALSREFEKEICEKILKRLN